MTQVALLSAEKITVYLTNRAIRRLHNRLGFPKNTEQLLEKLRTDLSEGYFGGYNRGVYGTGEHETYIIEFTEPQASIILKHDDYYLAISAFKRSSQILRGYDRVRVNWIYKQKEENPFPEK